MTNNTTITSATVNASARIAKTNYCTKDARPFRELVEDYMFRTFWYQEVKMERESMLSEVNSQIEGLSNLRGSALWTDANASQLLSLMDTKTAMESKLDEWIARGVKWSVLKDSVLDKTYKVYQKCMENGDTPDYSVRMAVNYLYGEFNLVCGTQDMLYILQNCGGRTAQKNAKKVYKSSQTVWTKCRTKSDFCATLISVLAEILIACNAVRPVRIAPELEAKYNKVRKASKKNSKKN